VVRSQVGGHAITYAIADDHPLAVPTNATPAALQSLSQPFAHDCPRGYFEAQVFVKRNHLGVRLPHQKLRFNHTALAKPFLGRLNHLPAKPATARFRIGRDVVEPTAMAIMADHDAAFDLVCSVYANQYIGACSCLGEAKVGCRVVIARNQVARAP
jgi:hypothetical protein